MNPLVTKIPGGTITQTENKGVVTSVYEGEPYRKMILKRKYRVARSVKGAK